MSANLGDIFSSMYFMILPIFSFNAVKWLSILPNALIFWVYNNCVFFIAILPLYSAVLIRVSDIASAFAWLDAATVPLTKLSPSLILEEGELLSVDVSSNSSKLSKSPNSSKPSNDISKSPEFIKASVAFLSISSTRFLLYKLPVLKSSFNAFNPISAAS